MAVATVGAPDAQRGNSPLARAGPTRCGIILRGTLAFYIMVAEITYRFSLLTFRLHFPLSAFRFTYLLAAFHFSLQQII